MKRQNKMDKEQELKAEVQVVLTSLEKINPDEISKENGRMDFDKLKERQEIKDAITQLKKLGVDRKYLLKHFNIAGLVIGHLLN